MTSLTVHDIRFDCGHCGGSLVVERQAAGEVVPCPRCETLIQIPQPGEIDPHYKDLITVWRARARQLDREVKRLQLELEQRDEDLGAAQADIARLQAELQAWRSARPVSLPAPAEDAGGGPIAHAY